MKIHNLKKIFLFLVFITFHFDKSFAQEGWQVNASANGGIGFVAPQNHYGNDFYELDYKLKPSFGGHAYIGYGWNDIISTQLLIGYQKYSQGYKGDFSPGLGAPQQHHEKSIQLDYVQVGALVKFATSFQDAYVYDSKAQLVVSTGFVYGQLLKSNVEYIANDVIMPYPSKLIPYTDPNYPYAPVSDSKKLYQPWTLNFVLNAGVDIFLTEQLALTALINGQASILDINAKEYRQHDAYKASRVLNGGLQLGLTYYINR